MEPRRYEIAAVATAAGRRHPQDESHPGAARRRARRDRVATDRLATLTNQIAFDAGLR